MMKDLVCVEPFGLPGSSRWPQGASALVIFAHGSGSSRLSPRNTKVAGGADTDVLALNERAFERLGGAKSLEVVPGASHLFSEPGALEEAIDDAARWFERYLASGR